jgi:hypothetical protein
MSEGKGFMHELPIDNVLKFMVKKKLAQDK